MSIKKILIKYSPEFIVIFLIAFFSTLYIFPKSHVSKATLGIATNTYSFFENTLGKKNPIKQTDGYTSILLLGIDSRELDFDGNTFAGKDRHTDTIIQAIYDHKNNKIFLISIPRDTGISVAEDCKNQGFDKAINRIYALGEDNNCNISGIDLLMKYTSNITGFTNHYYAMISFEAFHEVFDAIGDNEQGESGLWINIPEAIYELYPVGDEFELFTLNKGYQFLNSESLLRYSRSRKGSSDFDRAKRQQIVISALKDKLIDVKELSIPNIIKLINTFNNNSLYSDISALEIAGGIDLINKVVDAPIYRIVLDDTFGGQGNYLVRPAYSPPNGTHHRSGYYLTPTDYNSECCTQDEFLNVKKYLKNIFNAPEIYFEKQNIGIYINGNIDDLPKDIQLFLNGNYPFYSLTIHENESFELKQSTTYVLNHSSIISNNTIKRIVGELDALQVDISAIEFYPDESDDISVLIDVK